MKRITALFMVLLLCVCTLGTSVEAAGTPSIIVSSAEAECGDEVTIKVSIKNNPGIAMLELPISYDTTRLEKVQFTASGLPGGMVESTAVWIGTGDSTYNGTILTLKFKVKENAPAGNAAVSVSVRSASNWNEEDITFAVNNGGVTVTVPHVCAPKAVAEVPATCTGTGVKAHEKCECGKLFVNGKEVKASDLVIAATGHSYGAWTVTKEATCTTKGVETRTCACGATETRPIAALGHSYGDWTVTKEATCTEDGEKTATCTACDETKNEVIKATGHKWEEEVTKEATCEEDGEKTITCANCGETKTEVIKATGHDYQNNGLCGNCGEKDPDFKDAEASEPELDDVPKTGDIRPMIAYTVISLVSLIAASVVIIKRRLANN